MPTSRNETPTTDPSGPADPRAPRPLVRSEPTERSAGFRRLLESTRVVQWEADARTWVFTYVGLQAARLLGYPVERWYEPDFWATHVYPEDREWALRHCEQSTREREAFDFECRMIAASGQSIWAHDIVAVDRVDGAPAVIRGFLIDVSQRKRAEAPARAGEARFRQLIEQAPDAIIAVWSQGQIAFVNLQAERMFGYRRGELVGRGFEDLVPGQLNVQLLMAQQADGRSLEADGTSDDTAPITGMGRDGRTFPVEINFSPLDTDEGLVIVSTIRDISRRLAVETALRQSEERFRIAATLGADIVAAVDIKTGDVEWFGQVDQALSYECGEFPRTFDGWARRRVAGGIGCRHRARHRRLGARHDVRAVHQLPVRWARHGAVDLAQHHRGARGQDLGREPARRWRHRRLRTVAGRGHRCMRDKPAVFDDDDDQSVRRSVVRLLETAGLRVEGFVSAEAFLERERPDDPGCLVLDVRMSGMSWLELQRRLMAAGRPMAIVFITGHGDVPMSVKAMKAGAVDFLLKPFDDEALLAALDRAISRDRDRLREHQELEGLRARYDRLTPRQQQVFAWVATGLLNKQIAAQLGTGEKNIKVHRARVMTTVQAGSLADLVRQVERLQFRPVP